MPAQPAPAANRRASAVINEDMPAFFADFGDDATLAGQPVRVIFDAPSDASLGIANTLPQVQLPTSDVPQQYAGSSLVGAFGSFTVREHIPDGTGVSVLLLDRAAA